MIKDKFGQIVLDENDLVELVMTKSNVMFDKILVTQQDLLSEVNNYIDSTPVFEHWKNQDISIENFDQLQQSSWHMPEEYKNLDIAAYVLNLCNTEAELQRCGQELMMYQERNLFDLLKYLHYLVQIMKDNKIIWGVGRGSSVASFVLYKLGVHRVDSLFYDLDPGEFLR